MSDSIVIEESNGEVIIIEPTVVINQGGNAAWGEVGGDIGDQSDLVAEFAKKMNVEPTKLPVDTNFDTLLSNGVYQIDYNIITVKVAEDSSSGTIVNQIKTADNGTVEYRQYQGVIWGDWKEVAWWNYTLDELALKVDKVDGKGLSTNDYTTTEKTKLAGIEEGAQANVVPTWQDVQGKPSTFPPDAHNHAHNDLGGLNSGDYQHLTVAEKTKLSSAVTSSTVASVITLTQTAYNAIVTKDPAALYVITGA